MDDSSDGVMNVLQDATQTTSCAAETDDVIPGEPAFQDDWSQTDCKEVTEKGVQIDDSELNELSLQCDGNK